MCPQSLSAFPLAASPSETSSPVAVQASGCSVADARVHGRHSHGVTWGSWPPAAGITRPKLLTRAVALRSCLLLPPCPAATAAQLPPLLFVNH